jgi:transposase InsO family protein
VVANVANYCNDERARRESTRCLHAEPVLADDARMSRKRVERLMRQAGIAGLIARKRRPTTIPVAGVRVSEDLVDRAFLASAPDRLWGADTTYVRMGARCTSWRCRTFQPADRRWRRPLRDSGPRRTQGHEVPNPRMSAWRSPPSS